MENLHVLGLHGELESSQKKRIETDLDRIQAFGRDAITIVDLADARHVDTTFLNALLRLRARLDRTQPDQRIVLVSPKSHIAWRLFEISMPFGVFPLYESVALARRGAIALVAPATTDRANDVTRSWPSFVIEVMEPDASPEDRSA